jgi:hypothetical protein
MTDEEARDLLHDFAQACVDYERAETVARSKKARDCYHEIFERVVASFRSAVIAEREACARIVEGRVHKEHYREWPEWGMGNRSNGSEAVSLCDALAAAIRARGPNPTRETLR